MKKSHIEKNHIAVILYNATSILIKAKSNKSKTIQHECKYLQFYAAVFMFCSSITFPETVGFLALVNLARKCDQRGITLGFSLL